MFWFSVACVSTPEPQPTLAQSTVPRAPEVRVRPADPPDDTAQMMVDAVPGASWDRGLAHAAALLVGAASHQRTMITPHAQSRALAIAGYPGQARFARLMNGGAFPADLADQVALDAGEYPVDVGLARRSFGDGTTLWVAGWHSRRAEIYPIPRDLPLDGTLSLNVQVEGPEALELLVAPPHGPVKNLGMTVGASRWLDIFQEPGEYRFEVTQPMGDVARILMLFSLFVETEPGTVPTLEVAPAQPPNPIEAEEHLFRRLNELRTARNLKPVAPFPLFKSLTREHSALMASVGTVGHRIDGVTQGVEMRAANMAHPRAQLFENVATASTSEHAHALVVDSPGHLKNMLCDVCTHATIGAALEPTLDRAPRLFVTWELLAFPEGAPKAIDHYNR